MRVYSTVAETWRNKKGRSIGRSQEKERRKGTVEADCKVDGFINGNGLNSSGNKLGGLGSGANNKQNGEAESEKTDHVSKKRFD